MHRVLNNAYMCHSITTIGLTNLTNYSVQQFLYSYLILNVRLITYGYVL